jgi:N-acetylmuramoyl-L-alanine amidase
MKIAYCAGHYLGTPGKRVPKYLDPKQTREWTLNDRIARYFDEASKQYEDVDTLRVDDPTGKKHISIKNRTKKANEWGADLYVDMHHNAAGRVFDGGGVVAFSKKTDELGAKYRDAIYEAVVAAGGLKGNRANPLVAKNYSTMVHSKATAVLIEYGFMDSTVDYPIIATEAYAKKVGYATMEGIAKVRGIKKKSKSEVCNVELKVLKKGDKNDQVEAMQILLLGHGFKMENNGKTYGADGSYGAATVNGVKSLQKKHKMTQTAICDEAVWHVLLGVKS